MQDKVTKAIGTHELLRLEDEIVAQWATVCQDEKLKIWHQPDEVLETLVQLLTERLVKHGLQDSNKLRFENLTLFSQGAEDCVVTYQGKTVETEVSGMTRIMGIAYITHFTHTEALTFFPKFIRKAFYQYGTR